MKIFALILLVTTLVTNTRAVTITAPDENIVIGDVVVSPNGATQASLAPDLLPISEGARKTFLLSMATTGVLRYIGEGLVPIPNHTGEVKLTLNNETSATPAALLAQLTSSRISVGIANPHRAVTARCELFDKNGTLLLSGQAPAEVVPDPRVSGGYKIETLESIVLQCENRAPLLIENAESLDIIVKDDQGNIIYSYILLPNELGILDVWNWWNYRFGELVVNFKDGSKAFYSLTTGEKQQATATVTKSAAAIPNYVETTVAGATPSAVVSVTMNAYYTSGEIPSPPTYRIRVNKPTRLRIEVVCRDNDNNSVVPPTEWWYHRDDDIDEFMVPEFESYNQDSGTATFIIDTKPGVYWINAEGQEFRRHYWRRWSGQKG
jgi:hypothetical protein